MTNFGYLEVSYEGGYRMFKLDETGTFTGIPSLDGRYVRRPTESIAHVIVDPHLQSSLLALQSKHLHASREKLRESVEMS